MDFIGGQIIDKILCFSLHFLLGGVCQISHELTEAGKRVAISRQAPIPTKECVFLEDLKYQCGHSFGRCTGRSYENYIRNQAAALGADSIVISRVFRNHGGIGVYIKAKAYKCKKR